MINIKPEYRERIMQALSAFLIVVLSVIGAMVMDFVTEIGEPPISPIATPEPIIELSASHTDSDIYANAFVATGGVTAATLNASGAAVLNGGLTMDTNKFTVADGTGATTIAGNLTLQALLLSGFANITVTNGSTLTPTVTVYALDSGGAVTMTLAAAGTEGQLLILIGDDANNITIADTNLRSHDGAALVLGQYDVAMLVYQDAEWIQLVELANQ